MKYSKQPTLWTRCKTTVYDIFLQGFFSDDLHKYVVSARSSHGDTQVIFIFHPKPELEGAAGDVDVSGS